MKVAILMPMATQRGGGELMLWQLLEHTQEADIDWLVIFFEEGPLVSEFQNLGVETQIVPTGRLRHIHRYVRSVKEIASIVRSEDVDLVFSWSGKPHLYGSIAAKLTGVPSAWVPIGLPRRSSSHVDGPPRDAPSNTLCCYTFRIWLERSRRTLALSAHTPCLPEC